MITFFTVNEAKKRGLIPEPWHEYFPDTCDYCHGDLVINEARTIMKCNNPECCRRVANQINDFLKDLGYKGYGPETLTGYCQMYQIKSILDFINSPPPLMDLVEHLNNLNLSFPKLIELLHLPYLGTKAYKLFEGYTDFRTFLEDMSGSSDPLEFIALKVGGIETAQQVRDILLQYWDVLYHITDSIVVSAPLETVVNIAITGHITEVNANGRSVTKDEYVKYLNECVKARGMEFRQSGALQSVRFIVADSVSNSRKYKIGKMRNVLISSGTLLKLVEKMMDQT